MVCRFLGNTGEKDTVAYGAVVPNLGSIKPQGFDESVSGVRWQEGFGGVQKNKMCVVNYFFF